MKTIGIGDTWSIDFDPDNNDKPEMYRRHGEKHSGFIENGPVNDMFYRLIELQQACEQLQSDDAAFNAVVDAGRITEAS